MSGSVEGGRSMRGAVAAYIVTSLLIAGALVAAKPDRESAAMAVFFLLVVAPAVIGLAIIGEKGMTARLITRVVSVNRVGALLLLALAAFYALAKISWWFLPGLVGIVTLIGSVICKWWVLRILRRRAETQEGQGQGPARRE